MMSRITSITVAATIAVAAGWLGARKLGAFEPPSISSERSSAMSDSDDRETQIRVWKYALSQDPKSAIALTQLSGIYLQRARETGDDNNYVEAEQFARRSLALRKNRNGAALVTLAASLVAQHRFQEAETVAKELVAYDPSIPQYRAQLGEIQMELGHYDAARVSFDSLHSVRTHLSIAPRMARLYDL